MRPILLSVFAIALFASASEAYAEVRQIAFPVVGTFSFRNDFGDARDGGTRQHQGIDIIAAKMTPVIAVADGTITFIAIPQASWGYSITLRDSQGYQYRYLHLNNDTPGTDDGAGGESGAYAAGLRRGSQVTQGQVLGWVGDSGNAESTVSHLHFEIRAPDRTTINPYDSLFAAAGGNGSGTYVAPVTTGDTGSIEVEEQFVVTRQLQEGLREAEVTTLHTQLKTLGYYSGPITDTYDAITREAVRKFQNTYKLPASGIADALTRKTIETAIKAAGATGTVIPSVPTSSEMAEGSQGEAVRLVQVRLKELGYLKADATGYFGALTKSAVIAFQVASGIDPIGVVGPKTKAVLAIAVVPTPAGAETPSTGATPPGMLTKTLELGARGPEVQLLQEMLKKAGYFTGATTQYFGPITKASVIAFQTAEGIEPLGTVGPKTRAALNTLNLLD